MGGVREGSGPFRGWNLRTYIRTVGESESVGIYFVVVFLEDWGVFDVNEGV